MTNISVTRTADHTISVADLASAPGDSGLCLPTWLANSSKTEIGTLASPLYVGPGTSTTWAISAASLPLPSGAATAAKQPALGTAGTASNDVITVQGIASMTPLKVDGSGVTQPVSGTVTATGPLTDTQLRASAVPVSDGGGSITVDGTVSVSGSVAVTGTFWQATQPVSIAAAVAITDNNGSLTVDAPVDTPVYVRLSDGTSAVSTLPVSIASTVSVVGAAASGATKSGNPVQAGAVYNATQPTVTTGQAVELQGTSRGGLIVATGADTFNVTVNAALPAGTNAIGKLAANSGVTIGAVEIAASQTLSTVTTVGTVTTCSTVTTLTGGGVAHDGADSGNPVKVGAKAVAALSTATMVASADRTDATSDLDGAIVVRPQFPLGDLLSERVTDTGGTSTAFTNFGATASTRNYITAISVYNSSATAGYIDFRDGTGGSVLFTVALPAGGGAVLGGDLPLFRTSTNTALAYDVSGALSTVYISVSGFKSKV